MKYKNITNKDLHIPNVGIVKAGEEKEMPKGFNNANFKLVKAEKKEEVITNNK